MVDVFLSYPRTARVRAESIKVKLEALGLDCYFDLERIDGGVSFPDIIDRALRKSKSVLCCWTPLYFERPWCMIECRDALAREIMVPVAIEPFEKFAPPADLRQINWFDLVSWRGEDEHEEWRRTLLSLGKLTGRDLISLCNKNSRPEPASTKLPSAAPEADNSGADALSDLRATWAAFPAKSDPRAVQRFLDRVRIAAADSWIEFEVEQHLDKLKIAAERRTQEAMRAETAQRAREASEAESLRKERAARLRPGKVWRDAIPGLPKSASPEMITLAPGEFLMGSSADSSDGDGVEEPQHKVRIDYPFAIGNYVVTFAEWDAAIAVGAKLERPVDQGWGRDRRPVINVSWDDANSYIAWLNARLGLETGADRYRLPSEAEWEYACRAGSTTPYSFGETITPGQSNCRIGDGGDNGDYHHKTTPVGAFPANGFGLHDMHGNIWEWCEDVWNVSYSQPERPDDGTPWLIGDATRRVLRGGAWDANLSHARSASRRSFNPNHGSSNIGFRLARTILPPKDFP